MTIYPPELSVKGFYGFWRRKKMVEKKSKNRRERCPAGTHWNPEKKKCIPVRGKEKEIDEEEDIEEDIDDEE